MKIEEHVLEAKAAVKLYAESEADLIKLRFARKTTRVAGKLTAALITLMLGMVALVILLIALGFFLSDALNNAALGFLCSGGIALLLVVISAFSMRKIVERPIIQKLLKELSDVKL
jgi:hypothetical protein